MISIFCINYFSILAVRNEKKQKQRLVTFTDDAYLSAEMRMICFFQCKCRKKGKVHTIQ